VLFSLSCLSQQKQIDSLKKVIDAYTHQDTTYINLRLSYSRKKFISAPKDTTLLQYSLKTLELSKQLNFPKGEALSLNRIGVIYQYVFSNPYKAIENFQNSLTIVAKYGLPNRYYVGNIGNIANIYYEQKENEKALSYYKKMLDYPAYRINAYGYIANIYGNLNQLDSAIYYYKKVDKIARETKNVFQLANNQSNLSNVLSKANKKEESIASIEESLELIDKHKFEFIRAPAYSNAAKVYFNSHNFEKAKKYALDALSLKEALSNLFIEEKLWETLVEIYETDKDYANALDAYKKYVKLNDSITSLDRKLEISRRDMQFKADRDQAVAQLEIDRQRFIKNTSFVIGGALLVFGLVGYFLYKRKRDALEAKKVADFKVKVADTELKALRSQMNPHFIFNSLNSISDYMDKNDVDTANNYLVKFSKLTRSILESSEKKWILLKDDIELMKLYMDLESLRMPNKLVYNIAMDVNLDLENVMVPPLMMQPFIENSIWHGIAKKEGIGTIRIKAIKEGAFVVFTIDDDGVGRTTNISIDATEKTSLGLKITKSRLEVINQLKKAKGELKIIDKSVGVQVVLKLPLELRF
tara:strand:+ start:1849 stop:3600 length:1752 start_codon:yes stop_codon:yes gene_type:complete